MTDNTTSLVAATRRQAELLVRIAQSCEERGYCILLGGLNQDATNNYPFGYFIGGMDQWIPDWGKQFGKKYVLVHVRCDRDKMKAGAPPSAAVSNWWLRLPKTRRFKPLVVAFELMAKKRERRRVSIAGVAVFEQWSGSAFFEFRGRDKSSLDTAIAILEMEHHREIMTADYLAA